MRLLPEERTDEVSALSRRVAAPFLGQSVRRFALVEGFDRCIVLSSQALTALIPLFIVVASAAPAGQEDVISRSIIRRFNLTGASADAVEHLFLTPAGASSSVSVFSALLLIYSAMAFSRRLQSMYRAAWGRTKAGLRSTMYAGLGLVAFTVMIGLSYLVRELASRFPLDGSGRSRSRPASVWCCGRASPTSCSSGRCTGVACSPRGAPPRSA